MRLRFALAGLVVSAASLAACSSGTACGFGCPPTTSPTATPGYTTSGTETQNFTYYYGYPTTQPPVTITTKIAQTVTVSPTSLASPFPAGSANDVHVAEVDTLDGLQTIDLTGDSYTQTSGSNVVLYGSVENTPSSGGNAQSAIDTLVYATPQIIDQTPETSGATWKNQPGAQLTQVFGDGHSQDRTIANDGTYSESGTAPAPDGSGYAPVELNETSTGAGNYSGPFLGNANINFAFTAPTGTPAKITSTYVIKGKPKKTYFTIPAWYASNPTFYSESNAIRTGVTEPSGCGSVGGANEVIHKESKLDTIIGYTEQTERDTYTVSGNASCVVLSDTLDNFYDWNGDTRSFIYVSENTKKISEVATSETLVATASGGSVGSVRSHREHGVRSGAVATIPAFAVAALQDRFNAKIEATKRALFANEKGVR